MSGPPPRPAVIVPAHNEEAVVADGLRALLADARPGELDVVVACNGCTDATADRAREAAAALGHDITVLSLAEPSKVAAIRAAEEVATGFPRLYLDADVRCPTATARAMIAAVRDGAAVAVPRRVLDTAAAGPVARAYYEGWASLPWVQEQLAGRGAYTLGRDARATFGTFPDGIADDRFATTRVRRERAVIVDEPVVVRPPGRVREVLKVRRRVYAANQLVDGPAHDAARSERFAGLGRAVLARPALLPALAAFSVVTAVAKVSAGIAVRRGTVTWGRDDRRGGVATPRSPVPSPSGRPAPSPSSPSAPSALAPVDVVVLTYRSAGYVRECLEALDAALAGVSGARIIVVDNGSGDGLAAAVDGVSDRLELVLRDVNDGFAGGCHAGAVRSDAARLLFVNPDAVVDAGAVEALLACAERHPGAGIIGGRSVTERGGTDPRSWFGRPTLWSAVCFATGLSSAFPGSRLLDPESSDRWRGEAREVPVVSGGMMLVERHAWDALGGFDRDFFLYGEDVDLCLRARRSGWAPRVCPEARFRHRVGASSAGSNRLPLVLRGRVTTYRKNLPPPWGRVAGELLVAGTGLRALAAGLRRPGGRPSMGVDAWRDAWRRRAQWRQGWRAGERP